MGLRRRGRGKGAAGEVDCRPQMSKRFAPDWRGQGLRTVRLRLAGLIAGLLLALGAGPMVV